MTQQTPAPDILLIMTDQHRVGFTRRSGCPVDSMPRLDRLAEQGTAFDAAYTSYPACVPARTSLLTGRFPTAHRVRQNSNAQHAYYDRDLLDVLRDQGYSLHFAGKPHMHPGPDDFDSYAGPYWHAGGPEHTADQQEFDHWLNDLDHGVAESPTPFGVEEQLPYRITSDALAAIDDTEQDRPAFWWVSFPEPHNPYQVPEPYFSLVAEDDVPDRLAGPEAIETKGGKYRWLRTLVEEKRPGYDEQWRRYRANYLGMLRLIDDQIARLLDHERVRSGNTVVIFVSDHGDYVGDYGLQRKGAGMSDALTRIPFQLTGPGIVAGQVRDEPVSMVDLMPTVCELVGAEIPAGVQGRSLVPLLAGGDAPAGEFGSIIAELGYGGVPYGDDERPELHFPYQGRTFDELNSVTQSGGARMLRRGRHKLIMDVNGVGELYDLAADPAELDNLYDHPSHRAVREQLTADLLRWTIRIADDLPTGNYRPKTAEHNWRWATQSPPLEGQS
ncbi:sulfatase-like hydrolase/transferase [Microlunatus soli]|uniref:Arylsulfatase A n=1 Tax=Microlunatus soli TaxID=630515 RepID=A0A1H1ZT58_9ACTN|nr:sulfatase-like hydrolase/transferase [Microlunatus soli]SDT36466.1 Arylsulfatase A [Microlunatus soli]